MTKPTITEAHGLALAEYAERAKTPAPGDETIHFWDYSSEHSACGVDIVRTPYTYGSPERDEITCPACIERVDPKEIDMSDQTAPGRRPVVIELHVEAFTGSADETIEIDRDEWDRMSLEDRQACADEAVDTMMSNHVSAGWHIADPDDYTSAVGDQN
jgi:hypothetical protein